MNGAASDRPPKEKRATAAAAAAATVPGAIPFAFHDEERVCIAAHSHEQHEVEDADDLLFEEGDEIRILEGGYDESGGGEGWWRGKNQRTGAVGNFPSTYVEFPPRTMQDWMGSLAGISDSVELSATKVSEARKRWWRLGAMLPHRKATFDEHHREVHKQNRLHRAESVRMAATLEATTQGRHCSPGDFEASYWKGVALLCSRQSSFYYHLVTKTVDAHRDAALFILLFVLFVVVVFACGVVWYIISNNRGTDDDDDDDDDGGDSGASTDDDDDENYSERPFGALDSAMFAFLVLFTGEYDPTFVHNKNWSVVRWAYIVFVLIGIMLVSAFISVVNDFVMTFLQRVVDGRDDVLESGHTVVLGYNDNTARVCLQIAYVQATTLAQLRREWGWCIVALLARISPGHAFQMLQGDHPLLGKVVIMSNGGDKSAIIREIDELLSRHAVPKSHARWLYCVRVGDTSDPAELARVSAHRANHVLVSCTQNDQLEYEASGGKVNSGTTVRTLLALRSLLFTLQSPDDVALASTRFPKRLSVVIETTSDSAFVDAAAFLAPDGREVVQQVNTSMINNKLLFRCASSPGLSKLFLDDLLSFEGTAIRCLQARDMNLPPRLQAAMQGGTLRWKTLMRDTHWTDAVLVGLASNAGDGGSMTTPNVLLHGGRGGGVEGGVGAVGAGPGAS